MGFNATLKLKFGFKASNGKYLTTDSFGDKIHATGADMKKKQIFTIIQHEGYVNLIAPNGKYVTAGQKGELAAGTDSPNDDCKWVITPDANGTWAFKSKYDYYLANKGDEMNSFGRSIGEAESFVAQLANHPQVNICQPSRSSYVHLEKGQLNTNEVIPWGVDALINMSFKDGKYSLQASNGKYLKKDGSLVDSIESDSQYILEFVNDFVAFKASDGSYLQASGGEGKLSAKNKTITKNEQFNLEDSHPQVILSLQGKNCTQTGSDIKATSDGRTDSETFQMEIDMSDPNIGGKWSFRGSKGGYWVLNGTNLSESNSKDATSWFTVKWQGANWALQANNGKYLGRKPNGSIVATFDEVGDACKFVPELINRPQLILRSDFGYAAIKTVQGKPTAQCNNMNWDTFNLEAKNGAYAFKFEGKYLKLESDGSLCLGDSPEMFYIELLVHTKMAIKAAATGKYLKADQTGAMKVSANAPSTSTELWEY